MKIAVFGGTRGTGLAFVEQALEAGHSIQLLARTPEKMSISHEALSVVQGDVCVPEHVQQVIQGQDHVVCAIGGNGLDDSTTRTEGTNHIIASMKSENIRSLIVLSALGQGKSQHHLSLMGKMVLKTILRKPMIDHASQEKSVQESGLDWVIIRPPPPPG